jgi:hypothetical protein
MSLEFRGVPIADPAERNVRFAGYPIKGKAESIVVCEISADALRAFNDGRTDLIATFELHRAMIFGIAAAKFERGSLRPRVTKDDVLAALDSRRRELKRQS